MIADNPMSRVLLSVVLLTTPSTHTNTQTHKHRHNHSSGSDRWCRSPSQHAPRHCVHPVGIPQSTHSEADT